MLLSSDVRKLEAASRGTGNVLLALDCDFCLSIMKKCVLCAHMDENQIPES